MLPDKFPGHMRRISHRPISVLMCTRTLKWPTVLSSLTFYIGKVKTVSIIEVHVKITIDTKKEHFLEYCHTISSIETYEKQLKTCRY